MNRIERAVRNSGFFEPDTHVVVGFSGGADSTALLYCLSVQCQLPVTACHVNHMLRGDESDRDEAAARSFCQMYGIPLEVRRIDVERIAKEENAGVEETGRKVRYAFFEEIRRLHGAALIATAHTMSDQAETVLFRLTRGSGMKGLCGIPAKRGYVVRPLLSVSRAEVEAYCAEYDLPFITDSSNADCRYARNQIRNVVLPALTEIEPQAERAIARASSILSEEEIYLRECTEQAVREFRRVDGYDAKKLRTLPLAIRRRAAVFILETEAGGADYAACEALLHLLTLPSGSITVQGGAVLSVRRDRLYREAAKEIPPFCTPLLLRGETQVCGKILRAEIVSRDVYAAYQKIYKNLLYLALDYDTIRGKLILRQKQNGDRFAPAHRGGTRTLKKLFAEAGLSAAQKTAVPVLWDEERIVGVWGFGTDRKNAVAPETKRILFIYEDRMGEDRK